VSGGWITRADRAGWQRQAVRELAAILDDCDGLPLATWTIGSTGGGLSGRVAGPEPAGGLAAFAAWRRALGMSDALETPVAGGSWLRAGTWRSGVRVTVSVTVPAGDGNEAGS
jgi:hypothetical protein